MTDKEFIQALRICATHKDKGCGLCPQRKYVRCTERLADEAITMIERLTAKNVILPDGQASAIESLRKEIEWKDMVIALAQRKQAEAEAERDALREYAKTMQECEMCKNDTFCHLRDPMKDDCQHCQRASDCPCQKCEENNCWEWRGLPEAPEEGASVGM